MLPTDKQVVRENHVTNHLYCLVYCNKLFVAGGRFRPLLAVRYHLRDFNDDRVQLSP